MESGVGWSPYGRGRKHEPPTLRIIVLLLPANRQIRYGTVPIYTPSLSVRCEHTGASRGNRAKSNRQSACFLAMMARALYAAMCVLMLAAKAHALQIPRMVDVSSYRTASTSKRASLQLHRLTTTPFCDNSAQGRHRSGSISVTEQTGRRHERNAKDLFEMNAAVGLMVLTLLCTH